MPMKDGTSVGDMIVRHRKAAIKEMLARGKRLEAEQIRSLPAPRSMQWETWPPKPFLKAEEEA